MNRAFVKRLLLGIPKSVYANFKYLPVRQAIRLPILVSDKTRFIGTKGRVEIVEDHVRPGMFRVGLDGSGTASCLPTRLEINGVLRVEGRVRIGGGCSVTTIDENSRISLGRNTIIMGESRIMSSRLVQIGRDCMISWGVQIMDTDWHSLYVDDRLINQDEDVVIGDRVWICSNVTVLKGSAIPNESIIAASSTISSSWNQERCIVAGLPLTIIKTDATWSKDRPLP